MNINTESSFNGHIPDTFYKKLERFQRETRFSTYFSTGFYHILCGIILNQLGKLLNSLSIIAIYNYITPTFLYGIKYLSYFLLILGLLIIAFPLIIKKFIENVRVLSITRKIYRIFGFITLISIPIGSILGYIMLRDLKINRVESKQENNKIDRNNSQFLVYLHFICGIILIFSSLIVFILIYFVLLNEIAFLYPYLTYDSILLLLIFAWLNLITGIIIFFFFIWMKKGGVLTIFKGNQKSKILLHKIYLVSLITILLIFPFGSFFSLSLLLSQFAQKANGKEEIN